MIISRYYSSWLIRTFNFIFMNYSTLEPNLSYTTPLKNYSDFAQQWSGQKSNRFGRSIRFQPRKDLIKSNFELPDQTPKTGRSHFIEANSFEKPFKSSLHKVPQIKHWCLRQSKIRTTDFKPTEPHRRAERVHNNMIRHNPQAYSPQGLKTYHIKNQKTERQYSIEERMQRKTRIDQLQLRRTFYKDLNIFKR